MRRRKFIALIGGAAAMPLAARAQQHAAMPVVGIVSIFSLNPAESEQVVALYKGLAEGGFVVGQNVAVDTRWARDARPDQLLTFAKELVQRPVSILVASGSAGVARAAMTATKTIPIVFANGGDAVKLGLVASMNRPGGNVTGISFNTSTLGPKRLELLRELVPRANTIGFLVNPTNPVTEGDIAEIRKAAASIGQKLMFAEARTESEIDEAFAKIAEQRADALIVNVDGFFNARRRQLAVLAERYRIPTSYNNSIYVKAGGLMSYGDDRADSYRHVGRYVARILKGERPADLPVMQPTKFEFAINLRAAKSIGLSVSPTLLARADEVIE